MADRPKKILLLNDFGYPVGGAERYFFDLAAKLRDRGHAVSTVSSDSIRHGTTFETDFQLPHSGHWRNLDSYFNPAVFLSLRRLLAKLEPDVVHLQNIFYTLSPSILFALGGRAAAQTVHDYYSICAGDKRLTTGKVCRSAFAGECLLSGCLVQNSAASERLKRRLIRAGLKRVQQFLAPSEFVRDEFARNGISPVSVLHHPCEQPSKAFGAAVLPARFVYVGRLAAQKGVSVLLEAFKLVLTTHASARLTIVGAGPLAAQLHTQAEQCGISSAVDFTGPVQPEEVASHIDGAVAAVLPSLWPEVAGLSMYEAASLGVPAIASDIGGIPDFVRHEQTGLLCKPGDAQDLAAQMRKLLDSDELRRSLQTGLSAQLPSYSWQRHVESLEQVYDRLGPTRKG